MSERLQAIGNYKFNDHDSMLPQQCERPSFSNRDGALRTKLLTAKAADAVAVADFELLSVIFYRTLGAVALTNAALNAQVGVNDRSGRECVFERAACPLRKPPFEVLLRREAEVLDRDTFQRISEKRDVVQVRLTDAL